MSPGQFLAFAVRCLLAVLLVAGPLAADRVRASNGSLSACDDALTVLLPDQEQAFDDMLEVQGKSGGFDSDDGFDWSNILAESADFILNSARIIRIGRASHSTAPPNHRSCAAPPTGPPLA